VRILHAHGAYQPVKRQEVLANKIIQRIAHVHEVRPAQVALARLLVKNALPIPKAIKTQHIDENVASTNINLTEQDIIDLDNI
jgi:diketogulonate reductase-like aldo/keto reductase